MTMEIYFSSAWIPIKEKWAPIVATVLFKKIMMIILQQLQRKKEPTI